MAEVIQLSVDTGAIVVDINDRGEIIGRIRFNPNDLDIARRYESVVSSLEKVSVPEKASRILWRRSIGHVAHKCLFNYVKYA